MFPFFFILKSLKTLIPEIHINGKTNWRIKCICAHKWRIPLFRVNKWSRFHAHSVHRIEVWEPKFYKILRCGIYCLTHHTKGIAVVIFLLSFISGGLILIVIGSNWYILTFYVISLFAFGLYHRRRIYSNREHYHRGM